MISFEDVFGNEQVMVILRGMSPAETVTAANTAWDAGVNILEVPISSPHHVESLVAAVKAGSSRRMLVGAGTVTTTERVKAAANAGAFYTVAPGFDPEVLEASTALGLPHLPGVATASEVQHATAAGCTWLKVFPANVLGPTWFKAMRGPFPEAKFVATGGISAKEASSYLVAGARIVAVGTALTDPTQRDDFLRLVAERRTT